MFYIKKYVECWAIHNDETGKSRPLNEHEKERALKRFPVLKDKKTITFYFDADSLLNLLTYYTPGDIFEP